MKMKMKQQQGTVNKRVFNIKFLKGNCSVYITKLKIKIHKSIYYINATEIPSELLCKNMIYSLYRLE